MMDFTTYRSLEKKAWALVAEKAGNEMRHYSAVPDQPYWTHMMEVLGECVALETVGIDPSV